MARVKSAGTLLGHLASLRWAEVGASLKQLLDSPWTLGLLAGGFLLAWALALAADRRMSDVFSEFWYKQQLPLREALKRARAMAAAPALPAGSGTVPVLPLTVLGGQGGSQGDGLPIVHLPDGDGRGVQPGSAGTSPKA